MVRHLSPSTEIPQSTFILTAISQVEYTHLPHHAEVSLVLEYCDAGDLEQVLGRHIQRRQPFDEDYIWHLLHDIGAALAFLHHGIRDPDATTRSQTDWDVMSHLDIKPANIFLSWYGARGRFPRMVLGDFGCAVTQREVTSGRESKHAHRHGTREWFAPESFASVVGERNVAYGRPTDIWQLGAVAATLCRLWKKPNRDALFRNSESHCGSRYGRRLNDMVGTCLRVNRHARPRAIEVVHSANRRSRVSLRG